MLCRPLILYFHYVKAMRGRDALRESTYLIDLKRHDGRAGEFEGISGQRKSGLKAHSSPRDCREPTVQPRTNSSADLEYALLRHSSIAGRIARKQDEAMSGW